MKKILAVLLVAIVYSICGQEKNQLLNPGFEVLNTSGMPADWGITVGTDRKVIPVNGSNVLRLNTEFKNSRNKVSILQNIRNLPGGRYEVGGRIKGNIETMCIVASFSKGMTPPVTLIQISRKELKEQDAGWFSFSKPLTVPSGNGNATLVFEPFCGKVGESVYFDDLRLVPVQETFKQKQPSDGNVSSAAEKDFPIISGSLVARPAAASRVSWPVFRFAGKDYWQILRPEWLSMKGVDREGFVRNAGIEFSFSYTNRGEVRGDLRKTKIMELEIFRDGVNTAPEAELSFSSEEPDVIFYGVHNIQDGDPKTGGFIIGDSSDFRKRNDGVPFQIKVNQKAAKPVQKLRFIEEIRGCAPLESVEMLDPSGRVQDATYERNGNGREWILTPTRPFSGPSFTIRGKTSPSLYRTSVPSGLKDRLKNVPFMTRNFYFREHMAALKKENIDRDSIRKIQEEYPDTFIGQIVGEVAANYFQKRMNPTRFREHLAEQASYVPVYDRTPEEAEEGLKTHWKRHVDFFGNLCAMSGGLLSAPYFYEWGTPMVMAGSLNEAPFSNNRSIFTITRSGARQYGKPWAAYQTSYALGASASSRCTEEEALKQITPKNPWHDGLDFGLAPSVFKRCLYTAYYAGTSFQLFETDPLGMAVQNRTTGLWSLTENGKAVKNLYEWSVAPEGKRGDFYAPVLLLTDYYNGNWEWKRGPVWNTWYLFPYRDADYMFQHINRTFDPFPGHDFGKDCALMSEKGWSLFNSKLGDIYDIFFANPPSGTVSVPELGKYPVALLVGDIRFSRALLDNLKNYVKLGGTLVVNAAQDKAFFSDFDFSGVKASDEWVEVDNMKLRKLECVVGEIVAKASNGMPLIVRNRYGKGNVIFMTPYYLLDMKDKKQPLPLIGTFLEKIQEEVCPVKVSGNIHFFFNKMPDGSWKLVLLNHRGVYKNPMRTKEHFLPEYAAEVRFMAPTGTKAAEVRLHQPVTKNGNAFSLTVPSGEICIVDLENVAFGDTPVDARTFLRKGGFFEGHNPNQGLLLKSDFTENRGDVAVDSSGNEFHGKLIDGPVYEGDALKFDGKKSYVLYNLHPPKMPLEEGTIECWARPDGSLQNADQIVMTNEWIKIGIEKGKWYAQFFDFIKSDVIQDGKVDFDRWTQLVFTWDKRTAAFYVNGQEVIRNSGPLLHVKPLDGITETVRIFIGTHHFQRSRMFKGLVTGVRYYGHAVSGKEIHENYEKEAGIRR